MNIEHPYSTDQVIQMIGELAILCDLPDDETRQAFITWYTEPTDPLFTDLNLTSYNYWKFALHSKSPKALLSKPFLRYGSLPVSEASCERLFSRKRKLMTGNYSRSKQDLVSAKLIISDATKAEIDNLIQTSN